MTDKSSKKTRGVVYTPEKIVACILDISGYIDGNVRFKHVMENSCGTGSFLVEIVARYIDSCLSQGACVETIRSELQTYVHGLEIDPEALEKCIARINEVAARYGVLGVQWDVKCADATHVTSYDNQMDFVIGNPPYVRIQNWDINSGIKQRYSFSRQGMSDLFIVFYELGLRMLNDQGVLGYIAPSSFFSSRAGAKMRDAFVQLKYLERIVDLRHTRVFRAATYTTITVLKKGRHTDSVEYYLFDDNTQKPYLKDILTPEDYYIDGKYYFAEKKALILLKNVLANQRTTDIQVKNGLATLCDHVFISNAFGFQSPHILPFIKASKGAYKEGIFPYDQSLKPMPESELRKDAKLYEYLLANKPELLSRSIDSNCKDYWFLYGRSQGLVDIYKEKLAVNVIIRSLDDIKLTLAPAGVAVYAGLYIMSRDIPFDKIMQVIQTEEFVLYAATLGKYKSGGYYAFSSRDVKAFLDYVLTSQNDGL